MHHSAIAPLALFGSAVALHQTTTLFLPGFDQQPLVASIAGSVSFVILNLEIHLIFLGRDCNYVRH